MKNYKSKKAGENIIRTYDVLLKDWGVPYQELDVETTYGATHVITAGDENLKPLILFHGVGDDSALMWIYNAKELSQHYRIYAVDTIGGPGKSKMGVKYNKDFNDVLWIEEILQKLDIKKASFVGVSNGGYLVQLFTLRRPNMVEKAVSISAAVACGEKHGILRTMMEIFFPEAFFPSHKNTEKLIRKLSGDHAEVFTENPHIMEHYEWMLKGFNNMAMKYHKVLPFTEEEVDILRDKVYFLLGEEDLFQKLGGKKVLVDHRMNAHFYQGAGHGLNHEKADEINQMLIDIIEGKVHNIVNIHASTSTTMNKQN